MSNTGIILNIGNIKKFHENSMRLTILDHAVLFLLNKHEPLILQELHVVVNKEYRQTIYVAIKRTVTKLRRYGLVTYDISMAGYVITANGKKELKIIEDWIKDRVA